MENKQIFVKGLFWRKPADNAPDFVRGKLNVNAKDFIKFMEENKQYLSDKGWFNLQLLVSKDKSSYYFTVDTWKPEISKEDSEKLKALRDEHNKKVEEIEAIDPNSVPF